MKRIIDANINRCSEGLRVLEDILRFNLEDQNKTRTLREIRHFVRQLMDKQQLLNNRNSQYDLGKKISQQSSIDEKQSLKDIVAANFSRVQESLRVLEEIYKKKDYMIGKAIETKRFEIYSLEKHFFRRQINFDYEIYGITHALVPNKSHVDIAKMYLDNGIRIIQYREKHKRKAEKLKDCYAIKKMVDAYEDTLFIVNDDLDIAQIVNADGLHLGQEDISITVAKSVAPNLIIGRSTHNKTQATKAYKAGADYIGVGPMFETQTKANVETSQGIDYLSWVKENIHLPSVAIGGINLSTIETVLDHGGKTIAMISALKSEEDIKQLKQVINRRKTNEV